MQPQPESFPVLADALTGPDGEGAEEGVELGVTEEEGNVVGGHLRVADVVDGYHGQKLHRRKQRLGFDHNG